MIISAIYGLKYNALIIYNRQTIISRAFYDFLPTELLPKSLSGIIFCNAIYFYINNGKNYE